MKVRRYWPWLALLVLSAGLHLAVLGQRTFHHDESIHAQLSYDLARAGSYHYDPTYHGPLLYYLTAGTYLVAGDSDFTARLPIALAGILMLGVAWELRRILGERAAWWTGLLFTISPYFLYFGRFLRMDLLEVLTASAALLALGRALNGSERAFMWFGGWTALAVATKENAYVTAVLVVVSGMAVAVHAGMRRVRPALTSRHRRLAPLVVLPAAVWSGLVAAMPRRWAWLRRHWAGAVSAAAVFVLVAVPLYTVIFSDPGAWLFPLRAVEYWYHQHTIQRVGGPWWFHLPRLVQYEFLVMGAAFVWLLRRRRRLVPVEVFLATLGVASVAMYCYLGEKVPWLGVHQVWPFVPLAGCQLARTFGPHGRWWGRSVAVLALTATAFTSFVACFVLDEISPHQRRVESLQFVQTCPEMKPVVREGLQLERGGAPTVAAVSGEATWPLSWYWRHVSVRWAAPTRGLRPPLVVCDPVQEAEVREILGPGYERERVPLRAWWLPEETPPSLRQVVRYLFTLVPWGSIGSTDVIVLRQRSETPPPVSEGEAPAALSRVLGVTRTERLGEGWLAEPRGLAFAGDGRLAIADAGLGRVLVAKPDGILDALRIDTRLAQPEGVAWTGAGALLVADTWNHRVLRVAPDLTSFTVLPEPDGGWYGPRAVAVGPEGQVAVSDTGNKRIVFFDAGLNLVGTLGRAGSAPGQLEEPVGLAWVDERSVLVCDTGNRRLQVLGLDGSAREIVELPEAWPQLLSRPQVAVLGARRWLVTDPPRRALWLVEDGKAREIDLGDSELAPSGVAWRDTGPTLAVSDLRGRVWLMEVAR